MTITPNQNLVLRDINPSWRDDILSTLQVCACMYVVWWWWWGCGVFFLGGEGGQLLQAVVMH